MLTTLCSYNREEMKINPNISEQEQSASNSEYDFQLHSF